jgi:hypothetical protein
MAISATTATLDGTTLRVVTDGRPDPALYGTPLGSGLFPGNPNTVQIRSVDVQFTLRAGTNTSNPQNTTLGDIGIALNGVPLFNASAAPGPLPGSSTTPPAGFAYNAVYNEQSYGVDACGGHPEQNGEYHYHSGSFLANCWGSKVIASNSYFSSSEYNGDYFRHPDGHSKIVGFCYDGYPVYGPFGYENAGNRLTPVVRMKSSYRAFPSPVANRGSLYADIPAGTYIQDYEFVENLGSLDIHNGRYCATPEYPDGTYAYFMTLDTQNRPVYPYIFGNSTKEQRSAGGPIATPTFIANDTDLTITKAWSEGTFTYPVNIRVPAGPEGTVRPVCILLHGAGGNGAATIDAFADVLPNHILIAPTGFQNQWNVVNEHLAPDMEMLTDLIASIKTYANVSLNRIRILGSSNGGALAARAYIELDEPSIDIVCCIISQIHQQQYREGKFYKPSDPEYIHTDYANAGYDTEASPYRPRKYLQINNTNDNTVPYSGSSSPGPGSAIFLPAKHSSFLMATSQGYEGGILSSGQQYFNYSTVTKYSYLNNHVVQLTSNAGHNTNVGLLAAITEYFQSNGNTLS